MSLVSEALRKARRDAEAQGKRPDPRPRFFFSSAGRVDSRLGTGLLIGSIITMAAAAAGGLVAWWAIGGRQPVDPGRAGVAESMTRKTPPAAAAPETAGNESADMTESAESGGASGPEQIESNTGNAVPEIESPGRGAAVAEIESRDDSRSVPVSESGGSSPTRESEGPREFVAVATIGDVQLTLGYIVYRETAPFAQINGIDMRVGSVVEGFIIDEITRDRVILHDEEGPVVIRVH